MNRRPSTRALVGKFGFTAIAMVTWLLVLIPSEATAKDPPSFKHAAHGQWLDMKRCTTCHGVGDDWRGSMPGVDEHRACRNEACHADEFRKAGSTICLVCHETNEPYSGNPLKRVPPREWKLGPVPHPPHVAAKVKCLACHGEVVGAPVQEGHSACSSCHSKGNGLTMAECMGAINRRPRGNRSRLPARGASPSPSGTTPITAPATRAT